MKDRLPVLAFYNNYFSIIRNLIIIPLIVLLSHCRVSDTSFNGGFEILDSCGQPSGWFLSPDRSGSYIKELDSNINKNGKFAFRIEKVRKGAEFGTISFPIEQVFDGDKITFSGFLKTENVGSGLAGLWVRIDDAYGKSIAMNNTYQEGIKGTSDWKKVSITVPYDSKNAFKITVGGLLLGDGKAWFDDLNFSIDGKPLSKAKILNRTYIKVLSDTEFISSSKLKKINIDSQQIRNLTLTGQVWSFLKYHHPAIAKGDYNWDAELFRLLPTVINMKDNKSLSNALENFVSQLPVLAKCKSCSDIENQEYFIKPQYGSLFDDKILQKSLINRLDHIKSNRNIASNYYISFTSNGNPNFQTEQLYENMSYPDVGYRLLTLFRYWAIINYYFPSRNLIDQDWNNVLSSAIPDFTNASNEKEYSLAVLKLVSKIKDSHAVVYGSNPGLQETVGRFALPIQATFLDKKLVIIALHSDTFGIKEKLRPGDEITEINSVKIGELTKNLSLYISSSNYDTQMRDLSKTLMRTNEKAVKLTISRNGKTIIHSIPSGPLNLSYKDILYEKAVPYKILDGNIGYVFSGKYKNSMLTQISKDFKNVNAIIVDMRCYPSDVMWNTFGSYIKKNKSPFVQLTQGSLLYPGSFAKLLPLQNGFSAYGSDGSPKPYTGKVIVLVNSTTQSQAEYTTMAFQSASNVKVLGSTTAGADGNVSEIGLPGGLVTMISGLGVYYPDGTIAQRRGVKIDYKINVTIEGIKKGKDELLDRAINILHSK